jgi:RNA polymerase sigma factor (sigma-70 family)
MTKAQTSASGATELLWPNSRLVQECLKGNEAAWSALIYKFKNLIYSIPLQYNLPPDDASDIFQAVCLELLSELPRLREPEALPAWLIRVTYHKCFHWKRNQQRYFAAGSQEAKDEPEGDPREVPQEVVSKLEREQALREALAGVSPRCRQLVEMLFFESPARPYREVATKLGIASGSIGFIRGRCLARLKKRLEEAGFA